MKVKDFKDGMKDITIDVIIDYIPQNSWGVVFVKDETKDIKMILRANELKKAKEGMTIRIKKGNISEHRGQLQLNPNKDYPIEFLKDGK